MKLKNCNAILNIPISSLLFFHFAFYCSVKLMYNVSPSLLHLCKLFKCSVLCVCFEGSYMIDWSIHLTILSSPEILSLNLFFSSGIAYIEIRNNQCSSSLIKVSNSFTTSCCGPIWALEHILRKCYSIHVCAPIIYTCVHTNCIVYHFRGSINKFVEYLKSGYLTFIDI